MNKKLTIAILLTASIIISTLYFFSPIPFNSAPIYKTPYQINSIIEEYEIGESEYMIGTITTFTLNNGSGKAIFNNTITIGIPMSVNNSGYIQRGETTTFKVRIIREDLCCSISWKLDSIIEVIP